jgi:hypothetical protein
MSVAGLSSALGPRFRDPALDQGAWEPAQPRTDSALHRSLGLTQEHGDLAVRVAAEVSQLDRGALSLGQTRQRIANVLGLGEVPYLAFEVVAPLR